jgi:ElaB/YqjD/DUF883 family membrane-anchored ribosome-binding protein
MDTAQGIDSDSPEMIREQIEETRASLGQKLESLETEVRSSVQGASDSVKETVNNVKRAFDMRYQVRSRPWVAVGAAFGVGLALGAMACNQPWGQASGTQRGAMGERGSGRGRGERRLGSSSFGWMRRQVQPEIDTVKSVAIGAAVSLIGDLLKEALPQGFRSRIDPIVSSAAQKLGGKRASTSPRRGEEQRFQPEARGNRGYPGEEYGGEGYSTGEGDDLSHDRHGFAL